MPGTSNGSLELQIAERSKRLNSIPFQEIGRKQSFFTGTFQAFREVWSSRRLVLLLTQRDIKARYKDSSLGLLWSLVRPLVQLGVYFFIVGQVLGAARGVPDFAIYIFIGITTWGLFSETVSASTQSIVSNGGLVKKIYTPREIYTLSASGTALFNFAVQALLLVIVVAIFAPIPFGWNLFLIPLSIFCLFVFSLASGLLLATANVYLRDTQHLVEVALTLLFWFSPILYPLSFVTNAVSSEFVTNIYLSNPVTLAVLGMQKALWAAGSDPVRGASQVWPDDLAQHLIWASLICCIYLFISERVFSRSQGNFAQVL